MSASRLYPKTYKGKEDSSGYLARNDRPTSRSSPGWRGRVWISEPGWHWMSGWLVHPREEVKPMLNIKFRGLTDQEAQQYCAPKGAPRQGTPPASQSEPDQPELGDDDIPF